MPATPRNVIETAPLKQTSKYIIELFSNFFGGRLVRTSRHNSSVIMSPTPHHCQRGEKLKEIRDEGFAELDEGSLCYGTSLVPSKSDLGGK